MLTLDLLPRARGVGPAQAERPRTCADIAPTRTLRALPPGNAPDPPHYSACAPINSPRAPPTNAA
jgi:hypothetical protein